MLKHIVIGRIALPDVLTLTPEFFKEVRNSGKVSQSVHLRLRLYPLFHHLVVLGGVRRSPPKTEEFSVGGISVAIPKKQLSLFEGKLLGYERSNPALPLLGFLKVA